jgi:NhaP-type Na+/H+ and K+/H+ antiporter
MSTYVYIHMHTYICVYIHIHIWAGCRGGVSILQAIHIRVCPGPQSAVRSAVTNFMFFIVQDTLLNTLD